MKSHVSFLGALLLACMAAFIASVVLIVLSAQSEDEARSQALLSRAALEELNQVVVEALAAESGQRGYLLTSGAQYLEDYTEGRERLETRLNTYETLVASKMTPSQRENFDELRSVSAQKMQELGATVSLQGQGRSEDAVMVVRTDTGAALMDRLRAQTAALIREEQDILAGARAETEAMRNYRGWATSVLSVMALIGFFAAYRNLFRARKLDYVEQHALALAEERERTDLLARELSHRVKNLFSIVQSIIGATARQETDLPVAAAKIRERVHALSQAHSLTSSMDMQQQTSLAELIHKIVAAQANGISTLTADGPAVHVTAQHVTPLGMILHELTTNAVKYGAWSGDGGHIDISWTTEPVENGQLLKLDWRENHANATNRCSLGADGFGSRMINLSLSQLLGSSKRDWKPEGLHVTIELPLDREGALRGRNHPADR